MRKERDNCTSSGSYPVAGNDMKIAGHSGSTTVPLSSLFIHISFKHSDTQLTSLWLDRRMDPP